MSLLVSTNKFTNGKQFGEYYINPNEFTTYKNSCYYLSGELYSHTVEEVIKFIADDNIKEFEKVIGEFSIVLVEGKDGSIKIVNDKAGRNILYYSRKNGFTISDDFWSIVENEKYKLDDVDILSFKTQVFFSATPDYSTFLKELNIFPNAIYAKYDCNGLVINKYWFFRLIENTLTEEEKFDILDKSLNDCFRNIKNCNPEDTVYGIGVSGGLDSRIIPYYALKNKMKLQSFIIGQEKPHKLWKSNDHVSSELIVNHFKLNHERFEFDELTYTEKLEIDIDRNPIGSSQIFKIPNLIKANFDVLLTGASGFYVGSSPFYSKIRNLKMKEIVCVQQTDLNLKQKCYRLKKAINYLLTKRVFEVNHQLVGELRGVISKDEVRSIHNKIDNYLNQMNGFSNTEKLMNYATSVLGQRNKAGSFESLLNEKKCYTPYIPFLMDTVQYWTENDIYDRRLFERFIKVRLSDLAEIKGQDHKTALSNEEPKLIQKVFSLLKFVLRGSGVMNYPRWAKSREFKKFVNAHFKQYNYVSEYFDLEQVKKLTYNGRLDSTVLTGIIKLNGILNRINTFSK